MTKPKPQKHEAWLKEWERKRSPEPWPEAKMRQLDPSYDPTDDFLKSKPSRFFTLADAKQIAGATKLKLADGGLPALQALIARLDWSATKWVAEARVHSRNIGRKPPPDRRRQERGGAARDDFIWSELREIFETSFVLANGKRPKATATTSKGTISKTLEANRVKYDGPFIRFVIGVMAKLGQPMTGSAIFGTKREPKRKVIDAPKRRARQIRRRKRLPVTI